MTDVSARVEIPNRALFKATEVCDLVKVQPYVLRSWESEFPDLGVAKSNGAPRVYRRADVEQVLRIKHLLLVEGLTLAGARRKLEEEGSPAVADAPALDELVGRNAHERLTAVKRGLRSILELLSPGGTAEKWSGESGRELRLTSPRLAPVPRVQPGAANRANGSRGKSSPRPAAARTPSRRKR